MKWSIQAAYEEADEAALETGMTEHLSYSWNKPVINDQCDQCNWQYDTQYQQKLDNACF
ncbi:hypothetical protein [Nitrosomonas communis]|uniref:hypothetical protein n=1 Tax=Nitrosomonas communis TaxID=44574 RepID=UPI0015A690F2|nr:hypothetical protein [Nitrosomonas communis]